MHVVSVFDGTSRRLIGPFSERSANKLAGRLKIRARQIGLLLPEDVVIARTQAPKMISITVYPTERLGTLEAALTFNNTNS